MSTLAHSRLRAHLKLLTNRLNILQEKKTALAKHNRRQLAKVLEDGKIESARIRIENIIQEDIYIELLELLEIYSELVTARLSTIHDGKINDDRLEEALHVLIYAGQYTDVKELQTIKPLVGMLTSREFLTWASENTEEIPPKALSKIHIEIPKPELVDLYLLEIAKAFNVAVPGIYEPPKAEEAEEKPESEKDSEQQQPGAKAQEPPADDLWARFAALKK